jgi:uncharacterized protein YdeI (YjbR/CyaY-like superfamily)
MTPDTRKTHSEIDKGSWKQLPFFRFSTVSVKLCSMAAPKPATKTFDAVLEPSGDRLKWTIIRVPFDVAKVWGTRGQLRVKGEINGFPLSTSLFPTGEGRHILMVNKNMQAGGKAVPGVKARFRLEPDTAPRKIQQPEELLRVLRESKRLQKYYEALNFSMRREIARWVAAGKHSETRRRRAGQMAERLMLTMEAEHELPPLLQVAFRHNPKAQSGWELMPPSHRRFHLLGIFGYRNPESRARRIAKAVQEMVAYADKQASKRKAATKDLDADDAD